MVFGILTFNLQQMDKLYFKSELKLELFCSNSFPELELELFGNNFCLRAGAGAFKLYISPSELELEPQSSWGQIGAGSKLEPIVHLWVLTKSAQRAIQSINRHVRRPVCVSVVVSVRPPSLAISPRPKPDCIKPRFFWLSLSPARVAISNFFCQF